MLTLLKGIFWIVVLLALILIIGRIFFFEIARTDSYSMVPNISAGDTFLVFTRGKLGPGEIAMCKDPENPGMMVLGRIMGVPGSTFAIYQNQLNINGAEIQKQYDGPELLYVDNTGGEHAEFIVKSAIEKVAGHVYNVALMSRAGPQSFDKTEVEKGFFLLGDNRNRARDSRDFGEIPIADCVGTPFLIAWPGPDSGDFKFKNRFLNLVE